MRTYENYWVCASNYIKSRSQDDFSILRAASYSVGMFASDKLFIEIDLLTNMTVSYTHLDVYKRQFPHRAGISPTVLNFRY